MRAFAFAVFLALILIPKTSWVVRNDVRYLGGGYQTIGSIVGSSETGLVPYWPFRAEEYSEPGVRALLDNGGANALERLDRASPALQDLETRNRIRPFVLRRGFTSIIVSKLGDPKAMVTMRAVASKLLPLAQEGERLEPDNAYYPSCAWPLLTVLGRAPEAAFALSHAARCDHYDDGALAEGRYIQEAAERRFGYQGGVVRIQARSQVLLPQFAALTGLTKKLADTTPLTDPRRREVIRLAETMIRTGTNRITIAVARDLALRAMGDSEIANLKDEGIAARESAYQRANPDVHLASIGKLIRVSKYDFAESLAFLDILGAPWIAIGALLLVALTCALGISIPNAQPVPSTKLPLLAKLRRASWAWLALPLGAFADPRDPGQLYFVAACAVAGYFALLRRPWGTRPALVLGIVLSLSLVVAGTTPQNGVGLWLVPAALWLISLLPPAAIPPNIYFGIARALVVPFVAYAAVQTAGHGHDVWLLGLGLIPLIVAIRAALPQTQGLGWLPAALAVLYLGLTAAELTRDAQLGAVLQRFEDDANQFRIERGIR